MRHASATLTPLPPIAHPLSPPSFVPRPATDELATGRCRGETPTGHIVAGSCGEVMACLVRVPTENVKQKLQAGIHSTTTGCVKAIIKEGGMGGFYQGCMFRAALPCLPIPCVPAAALRWQ